MDKKEVLLPKPRKCTRKISSFQIICRPCSVPSQSVSGQSNLQVKWEERGTNRDGQSLKRMPVIYLFFMDATFCDGFFHFLWWFFNRHKCETAKNHYKKWKKPLQKVASVLFYLFIYYYFIFIFLTGVRLREAPAA